MIEVNLTDNAADGFNGRIEIAEGTTIAQFFEAQKPGRGMDEFTVRVNSSVSPPSTPLTQNDRVTFTPKKVEGA